MSRWIRIVPVLGALVWPGVDSAYAQSSDRFQANIPFEFKVGNTVLPAGRYDVSYDAAEAPGVLVVRSQDGHHEVFVLTESVDNRNPEREARFVFEREGQSHLLSEIFAAGARTGHEVLGTHATD